MMLVTGGAGFIGSNIVAALSGRGTPVAVCDYLGNGGKWHNLAKSEVRDVVHPDCLDSWLDHNVGVLDAILHMGAISATDVTDADLVMRVNFGLTLHLWQWCVRHHKRFLYASSAATYGDGSLGYDDDASPAALAKLQPLNLYGWSKHLFDRHVARALADREALPAQWAGLKFFNVYGPNEYHKGSMQSVVAHAYRTIVRGEPVSLFKSARPDVADGDQRRDFVYVGDCVNVMLWLLDHPTVNGLFNVGTGTARSFADLARVLFAVLGRPPQVVYRDMPDTVRAHYQYFTEARLERLRAAGYAEPFTSIEDGVRTYVSRHLSQPDPYR
ncbi:MAG TPA: ADP-glyceromanno-heptose 6-epimerase [Rhodanobacteraceae bacterium]|nr:ADP-glyceromanno-heptose 6-epimerase [Rhodanobacteraceae bacterium]